MGLKEYFKKQQKKKLERRAQMDAVRAIQMKSLQEERLKQAKVLGEQQARIERKQKVKQLQQQVSRGGSGLMGAFSRRVNIAAENLGYGRGQEVIGFGGGRSSQPKQKKQKYITVKGKKYMRAPSKKKRKKKSHSYPQQEYNPFQTSL